MSLFKKLQEKRTAERVRKSERMQGFTMQAELSATIVSVRLLDGAEAETRFLVEYANGEKKEEAVKNDSERFRELSMYLGKGNFLHGSERAREFSEKCLANKGKKWYSNTK